MTVNGGASDGWFIMPATAVRIEAVYTRITDIVDANAADALKVFAADGLLIIEGAEAGQTIQVYAATGTLITQTLATAAARTEISLAVAGAYLVRIADIATMIIVN